MPSLFTLWISSLLPVLSFSNAWIQIWLQSRSSSIVNTVESAINVSTALIITAGYKNFPLFFCCPNFVVRLVILLMRMHLWFFQWLNNCIGKRNYRQFFTLMVTALLLVSTSLCPCPILQNISALKLQLLSYCFPQTSPLLLASTRFSSNFSIPPHQMPKL